MTTDCPIVVVSELERFNNTSLRKVGGRPNVQHGAAVGRLEIECQVCQRLVNRGWLRYAARRRWFTSAAEDNVEFGVIEPKFVHRVGSNVIVPSTSKLRAFRGLVARKAIHSQEEIYARRVLVEPSAP